MNNYYGLEVNKIILTFSESLAARDSKTDFALKSKTIYHIRLVITDEDPFNFETDIP